MNLEQFIKEKSDAQEEFLALMQQTSQQGVKSEAMLEVTIGAQTIGALLQISSQLHSQTILIATLMTAIIETSKQDSNKH